MVAGIVLLAAIVVAIGLGLVLVGIGAALTAGPWRTEGMQPRA